MQQGLAQLTSTVFGPQGRLALGTVRQLSILHRPQAEGFPEQGGADSTSGAVAAKTLSFFSNCSEPQSGHCAPDQS